jgi:Acetyltransferase (GNAT) domain
MALLKRMVALRFVVPSDRLPFLSDFQAIADVTFSPARPHAHLKLPTTYDEFLGKLGPRTRRNFRHYRRKSERAGNEFSSMLEFAEFVALSRVLLPNAAYATAKSKRTLDRHLAMIEAMPSRILIGLRRVGGEWIGLAGGWRVGDRTILAMQLNNRTYDRESLSIVLRSYLIEALIKQGVRELVFWGDTSAPLCFYAVYPSVFMVNLDAPLPLWRFGRWLSSTVRKLTPITFAKLLNSYVRNV